MARRLAIQGANQEDIAQLRQLLAHASAILSAPWQVLDTDDAAELLIIDVDSVYGHMDWLRAHNARLVAAFTSHPSDEYELVLHKPLALDNLVEMLDNAAERSSAPSAAATAPVEAQPAARAPRTAARPAAPPIPASAPATHAPNEIRAPAPTAEAPRERHLADWLADGALHAAVRLRAEGAPDIILDPGNRMFHADGNLRALAPHCNRVVAPEHLHEINSVDLARVQASGKGQPWSRLVWLCHALGSRGRIASGLDSNGHYKLARWPQIEREFPRHFRIATVMMKQPATLAEVAAQSGASLEEVIEFTNAYHAIGFIEREDAAGSATASRDTGRNAILSRFKNPFAGKGPSAE